MYGAHAAQKELLGARADDMTAKVDMYNKIAKDGYVSLETLETKSSEKVALNTLDVMMLSAGLHTDLINSSLVLNQTLK